jgi:haloacid dehalogenase-like hydrolase
MKGLFKYFTIGFATIFFFTSCQHASDNASKTNAAGDTTAVTKDPLPSWNDPLKQDIIDYVNKVSKEGSANFVPVKDRIATIDNDGTLWAEIPLVQELFAYYRVKKMVTANPALAKKQPFLAVVTKDKAYFEKGGEKALIQLVGATHTGMTEDQFEADAKDFFATAMYPGRNVPISKIVYQPQLELLNYLRANGFMTYIVTGGTIELVRTISDAFYGIPKNQVVGTTFKYQFIDSNRSIMREPAIELLCDQSGKPVGIQVHIGQRPIFSMGNERSGGDIAMCKFCQGNHYPSFQMIVNHDDSLREYFYQEKDSASLKAAAANKWHVISMKNDWKTIFPQ